SGSGKPGAPGTPIATSSTPTRERIATPFHCGEPFSASSYPRPLSSSPRSASNASSVSFVSCRQTISGRRSSSQGSRRGTRCLTEFTFHVATRTGAPHASAQERPVARAARSLQLRRHGPALWVHEDLGVRLGVAEGRERVVHALQADRPRHERRGV